MEIEHEIQWEEAQVIASEPHLTKRKVKESVLIRRTPTSMKIEKYLKLDNIYYPSINTLVSVLKTTSKFSDFSNTRQNAKLTMCQNCISMSCDE